MKVDNIRWERNQGYPILRCTIDGVEATIPSEQKPLLTKHKIIFIGGKFAETHIVKAPPELRASSGIEQFEGFTDDPNFYENVFLPFAIAVRDGTFEPKTIR